MFNTGLRPFAKPLPSREELHELLSYDPVTGLFLWRYRPESRFKTVGAARSWNKRFAGKEAFNYPVANGYRAGTIDSAGYLAHRVAWKMMTGEEPPQIDHINGVRDDNRFENLRAATNAMNCKNAAQRSDNTSGVKGVSWDADRHKWSAEIVSEARKIHLGRFDTLAEAKAARIAAERVLNFHPNHGRAA